MASRIYWVIRDSNLRANSGPYSLEHKLFQHKLNMRCEHSVQSDLNEPKRDRGLAGLHWSRVDFTLNAYLTWKSLVELCICTNTTYISAFQALSLCSNQFGLNFQLYSTMYIKLSVWLYILDWKWKIFACFSYQHQHLGRVFNLASNSKIRIISTFNFKI